MTKNPLFLAIMTSLLLVPLTSGAQEDALDAKLIEFQHPSSTLKPHAPPKTGRYTITATGPSGGTFEQMLQLDAFNGNSEIAEGYVLAARRSYWPCSYTPLTNGRILGDGTIIIESIGPLIIPGCERTFRLKFDADGTLVGDEAAPNGNYPVRLKLH